MEPSSPCSTMTMGPFVPVVQSTSMKSPSGNSRRSRRSSTLARGKRVFGMMVWMCRLRQKKPGLNSLFTIIGDGTLCDIYLQLRSVCPTGCGLGSLGPACHQLVHHARVCQGRCVPQVTQVV